MSRIRTIKPEWLDDERMSSASPEARVLSVALILLADDYGRGRAGRLWLLGRVFPGMAPETIDAACGDLAPWYVRFYEVGGQSYFELCNWSKHQRVERPGAAKVPRPNLAREAHGAPPNTDHGDRSNPDHGDPVSSEEDRHKQGATNNHEDATNVRGLARSPSLPGPFPGPAPKPEQPSTLGSPGPVRRARSAKPKQDHRPFLMTPEWSPGPEFIAAQAAKFECAESRVAALLPEFRDYWIKRGDRKNQQNWERTFANNVGRAAQYGTLYAAPSGSASAASTKPSDEADRRRRAAEAEARVLGRLP